MEKIDVENLHLRYYIRKYLGLNNVSPRYGYMFDDVVEEAFVRMQYVLDLSPEEFLEDLENLDASLDKIKFEYTSKLGLFWPSKKSILLNNNHFYNLYTQPSKENYCQLLLEVLIHELLHAMQLDKDTKCNRAEAFNKKINDRTHAIFEICTQAITSKCVFNRDFYDMTQDSIITSDGYSQEIFAVPLLAATFGVPEKTIMKYGVRQRSKLLKACDKNIGDTNKTADLLQRIEDELATIHSIYYPNSNQTEFKNLNDKEKVRKAKIAYTNLIRICNEALAERIVHLPNYYDKSAVIQLKFDLKKILGTAKDVAKKNYQYFNIDESEMEEIFYSDPNFAYFKKSTELLKELGKPKNKEQMPNAPEIIASIKDGTFSACDELLEPESITMSIVYKSPSFVEKVGHEDYNDYLKWDNSEIFNIILGMGSDSKLLMHINPNLVPNSLFNNDYYKKMKDLRYSLLSMKEKNRSKYAFKLSQILSSSVLFDKYFYRDFSITIPNFDRTGENISPYYRMKRSFNSNEDKVFLANAVARRFVDTVFTFDDRLVDQNDKSISLLQSLLHNTVLAYGHEHVVNILKDILLNDDYSRIENDVLRTKMAILGRRQITDIVLKPFIQTLLNERTIIPEKKHALQLALVSTKEKYPGSEKWIISELIESFKTYHYINPIFITIDNGAKAEFIEQFHANDHSNIAQNMKDMEDLVGLICDTYSSYYYDDEESSFLKSELEPFNPIKQILDDGGPDYFRENIIKTQLYNNYSGLYDEKHKRILQQMNLRLLMEELSKPFIEEAEKSLAFERKPQGAVNPVTRAQVMEVMKPNVLQNIKNMILYRQGFSFLIPASSLKAESQEHPISMEKAENPILLEFDI